MTDLDHLTTNTYISMSGSNMMLIVHIAADHFDMFLTKANIKNRGWVGC